MSKEIEDFMRLANRRHDHNKQIAQDRADKLADELGVPMVVIGQGGHYQVWHKSIANRSGADIVYDTSTSDGGNDND